MGEQRPIRIASMHISATGFRQPKQNVARQVFLQELINYLTRVGIDLAILPAGYFTAPDQAAAHALLQPIFRQARSADLSLVVGVDQASVIEFQALSMSGVRRAVRRAQMPCFLYASSPDSRSPQIWRQRSSTPWQATEELVPASVAEECRAIRVGHSSVEAWVCGECYDPRVVQATQQREPAAVFITGHLRMPRFAMTMKRLAKTGLTIIQSEHRIGPGGLHYAVSMGADCRSQDGILIRGADDLWAQVCLWDVLPGAWIRPVGGETRIQLQHKGG